jgi:hypothetical protein
MLVNFYNNFIFNYKLIKLLMLVVTKRTNGTSLIKAEYKLKQNKTMIEIFLKSGNNLVTKNLFSVMLVS